jgi:hypothetical protein
MFKQPAADQNHLDERFFHQRDGNPGLWVTTVHARLSGSRRTISPVVVPPSTITT